MMVKKIEEKFQFEECEMFYKNQEMAQKCENWRREHKSCNLDIIKEAIK